MELQNTLSSVFLYQREDRWVWKLQPSGEYIVKLTYDFLSDNAMQHQLLSDLEVKVFSFLWKSSAPLNVKAFSWQMILERLPTRDNVGARC